MSKLISKVVVPDPNEAGGYSLYNIKDADAIRSSEKGSINGVATLNDSGKVPSSQLPSYVDDVIEGYYNESDGEFYYNYSGIIDDAAREILGSGWRMPTSDEILSLIDNTNKIWSSNYQNSGVAGLVCTDKTDNSKILFFPACGMCMGNLISLSNLACFYFSSLLAISDEKYALCFITTGEPNIVKSSMSRYAGMPIRAVLDNEDSSQQYVEIGGIKWATKNIGASNITDNGLYFLWGDVIGYTSSLVGTDKIFLAQYYKYFDVTGGQTTVTKYNSTDGLTTLELGYSSKITPESGKIYIDILTAMTYRWGGNTYAAIKGDVVIGTTTGTAADGKVVNDHVTDTDIHITAAERALWDAKLPLAGGTMTGGITMPTATNAFNDVGMLFGDGTSGRIGMSATNLGIYAAGSVYIRPDSASAASSTGLIVGSDSLTYNSNSVWDTGSLDIQGAYRYSIGAGKTVKLSFGTYYQAIIFGRATNGATNDLILIGVGYSSTNHWRALYKGSQCSWGVSESDRSIEIKNTYSEGNLHITVLMLRSAVTFTEIEDLTVTPVTAVMALTTSNVASATALNTARSLWGNSFDGTADINGSIDANENISVTRTTTTASKLIATNSKGSVSLMTSTNRGVYDDTNSKWLITTNGTNTWLNCGNVAIASAANTSYKLYADGTVGATNFYTTSDRSKKENIEQFSEHISKFTLKENNKDAYGVIAQDVPEMFREGVEGNYTVNYASILSYYVGVLENKVQSLEDELKELKKEMNNVTSIN